MKSSGVCILDIRKPNGQFWTRVKIPLSQWRMLDREAKAAGLTVMGLIMQYVPAAIREIAVKQNGKAVAA